MLHLFGGVPCFATLIAKFGFLKGGAFRPGRGGCWVGDAMLEPKGKKTFSIFEQSGFSHLVD